MAGGVFGATVATTVRGALLVSVPASPPLTVMTNMVAAAAAQGVTIPHLIGPNTAHKYHPETKLALASKVDAAAEAGAPEAPEEVRLSTFTLRYNLMDWVEITGLKQHWEPAVVRAKHAGKGGDPKFINKTDKCLIAFRPNGRKCYNKSAVRLALAG